MISIIIVTAVGYLLGSFAFCLWDSWIGMPVDWNDRYGETPPLGVAAAFWPIAVPIVALIAFNNYLKESKENRIVQEKNKQKLRIAQQKEMDEAWEQIEEEAKGIAGAKK